MKTQNVKSKVSKKSKADYDNDDEADDVSPAERKSETPSDVVEVTNTLPPVAKSIYIECKKCGQNRYHKVLAHKTEKSAKVECEVCHKKGTFTLKKPKVSRKPKAAKTAGESLTKSQQSTLWKDLTDKMADKKGTAYSMKAQFQKDEVITHPKFGRGFVISSSGHRLEVLFEDSVRALVQGMS